MGLEISTAGAEDEIRKEEQKGGLGGWKGTSGHGS